MTESIDAAAAVLEADQILQEHAARPRWAELAVRALLLGQTNPTWALWLLRRMQIAEEASRRLRDGMDYAWLMQHFGKLYLEELERMFGGDR